MQYFDKYDFFLQAYEVSRNGDIIRKETKKKISPIPDKDGYLQVRLSCKNIQKTFKIHRFVGYCYIPNPDNKPQINHINGIKTDNRVENLEWCDNRQNSIHKHLNKLSDAGVKKCTNKSGIAGVHFDKIKQKYIAQIQFNKKKINLGAFNNILDAKNAYWKMFKELRGYEPIELKEIQ